MCVKEHSIFKMVVFRIGSRFLKQRSKLEKYICKIVNDFGLAINAQPGITFASLQWRHNERDGVSNHHPHDCLLKRLFRCRSKKTSKLRVTGLCAENSQMTGEFPAQKASNAEDISIWWRHHVWKEHQRMVSSHCDNIFNNFNTISKWKRSAFTVCFNHLNCKPCQSSIPLQTWTKIYTDEFSWGCNICWWCIHIGISAEIVLEIKWRLCVT